MPWTAGGSACAVTDGTGGAGGVTRFVTAFRGLAGATRGRSARAAGATAGRLTVAATSRIDIAFAGGLTTSAAGFHANAMNAACAATMSATTRA
jgi:hypothetical protein